MKCNICNHFDAIDPIIGRCKSCAENLAKCYYLIQREKIKAMPPWFENHWPIEHSMIADGMFLSHESCRRGHIGLKKADGKCAICEISPTPRQAALKAGLTWYIPTEPCKHCHQLALRRVSNGQCKGCADLSKNRPSIKPLSPRQHAIANGENWYLPHTRCRRCGEFAKRRVTDGQCSDCLSKLNPKKPPSARQLAITVGLKWYTPEKPCKRCGETALRHVSNGRCKGCDERQKHPLMPVIPKPLTARQQAIKEGKKWYMPDRPCNVCQTVALKRVDNGQCSSCQPPKRPIQEVDPSINLDPDTIIKRPNAKAAGLKYYRTGKPCRHGHAGFRYVSTGACVDCNKSLHNNKRCV